MLLEPAERQLERGMGLAERVEHVAVLTQLVGLDQTRHRSGGHRVELGEGPADAKIMFIGEAPGFNEDRQGRPFVGAAGQFLSELLAQAGLRRQDVFIANVVKHRPPNNRDPEPDEIAALIAFLLSDASRSLSGQILRPDGGLSSLRIFS